MRISKRGLSKRSILILLSFLLLFTFSSTAFGLDRNEEIDIIKHYILKNYVNAINENTINKDTPEEIFEQLDKHSTYYSQKEFSKFIESIAGEFVGIGVYIEEQEEYVTISGTIKESPAEKAGLLSEDKIVTVNGKNMKGLSTEEVANNIRGPIGTEVDIEIKRGDKLLNFTVTRDNIVINPVEVEVIDNVGYIKISQFNEHTATNFLNAVGELYFKKIDKLIIDLRNNPGGSVDEVVSVSRLLVPKGPIVHIDYKNHRETYVSLLKQPIFKNVVILVNENSASASEILAGAVQDTGAGTIIGKPTYGKGSVQRIYFLSTGAGFKLTEAIYRTPNGIKIDGVGVTPDIEVDRFFKELDIGNIDVETLLSRDNDQQLQYAIKYLNGDSIKKVNKQ